jgi:hypothetical protein
MCKLNGLSSTFHEIIYFNRIAVPVEKDLSSLEPMRISEDRMGVELIEISERNFTNLSLKYPIRNRYQKALRNIRKGYRAFALIKGNEVIGDVWYAWSNNTKKGVIHPDLKWLGIYSGKRDVYVWDMYVKPNERGGFMATSLLNGAMRSLKKKGFGKLYGYYWQDNIPALWTHRVLRFRELKTAKMHRFVFIRRIKS